MICRQHGQYFDRSTCPQCERERADPVLALAREVGPREEWLDGWIEQCVTLYRVQVCYTLRVLSDGRAVAEDFALAFATGYRWHLLWHMDFLSYATLHSGIIHSSLRGDDANA